MVDINNIQYHIDSLGQGVVHPNGVVNFTQINQERVDYLANLGKEALPFIQNYIETPKSFDGLLEALFVVDKMADNKLEGLDGLYPSLSKYNNSACPEIQTILSGIYRKILVPDAFGPLCRMLYKQVTTPNFALFDPSEETGGAILEYLRAYGANNMQKSFYGNTQPALNAPLSKTPATPSLNRYGQNYPSVYRSFGLRI